MKKDLFLHSNDNDYKREKLSADVRIKACVVAELLSVNLHDLISSHFLSLLLILLYHREHVAGMSVFVSVHGSVSASLRRY